MKNDRGGVNVCYGIQEIKKKTFVEAAQRFKQTISETVTQFIEQFGGTQSEAEATVRKYWKTVQDTDGNRSKTDWRENGWIFV